MHKVLNPAAGNYAIDFAAGINSGSVNAATAIDLTVLIGTATPPRITANTVTFRVGKAGGVRDHDDRRPDAEPY